MNNLDLLADSIRRRIPISFQYNKPNKVHGQRIGNVHAIFILTAKSGKQSTKVHVVQTAGVSDSKEENPFPDFRMFNIEDLSDVQILESESQFSPDVEKYNPEWEGYKDVIAKV